MAIISAAASTMLFAHGRFTAFTRGCARVKAVNLPCAKSIVEAAALMIAIGLIGEGRGEEGDRRGRGMGVPGILA